MSRNCIAIRLFFIAIPAIPRNKIASLAPWHSSRNHPTPVIVPKATAKCQAPQSLACFHGWARNIAPADPGRNGRSKFGSSHFWDRIPSFLCKTPLSRQTIPKIIKKKTFQKIKKQLNNSQQKNKQLIYIYIYKLTIRLSPSIPWISAQLRCSHCCQAHRGDGCGTAFTKALLNFRASSSFVP